MKVTDILKQQDPPVLSFEITPPEKGKGIDEIFRTIDVLMPFEPQFINVTYHQPHVEYEEHEGVIHRVHKRKKPGTVGICTAIKHRYNLEPVPHFICGGFTRFETEDALIDLQYLGIENILALRGDPPPGQHRFVPETEGHSHALGLVEQIANMNHGHYLEPLENAIPTDFCIGVAGYPEKHYEAPNGQRDLEHLKSKVDNGAEFIISQMFFEFDLFRKFVEDARQIGIEVPILPGIKPISRVNQAYILPRTFRISVPDDLIQLLEGARTPAEELKKASEYMAHLMQQLLDFGVPGIHIYTMGKANSTCRLLENVFGKKCAPCD